MIVVQIVKSLLIPIAFDLEITSFKLVDKAKDCGATTVKFQTHIAEAETLRNAPSPKYFKNYATTTCSIFNMSVICHA